MSIRKPLIGFTLFMIVALVVTFLIWSTLQRSVSGDTTNYSAVFTDVSGLKVGDDVRMAGVRVGRVEAVELVNNSQAQVDFKVQSDQTLFDNTKALVRYQNLIGQRYVALAPGDGSAAPLAADATIPVDRTEPSFDVSLLLNGFAPLFDVLKPEQINELSDTLVQALQGDGVSLSAFITNAAALARTFADRDQIISSVIENLSGVLTGLAGRSSQLETLIAQTRELVGGLYAQGQTLQRSTEAISTATDSILDLVTSIRPGLQRASNSTNDAINLLVATGPQLDQGAIAFPPILNDLTRVTGNGAYINLYPCRLDVSLWGVLFPEGLFSQIGGNQQSEVCR